MSTAYRIGAFVARSDSRASVLSRPAIASVLGDALGFWRSTTAGYLDMSGSEVLPTVDVTDADAIEQPDPRNRDIALAAYEEQRKLGDITSYGVLLVFVHPGEFLYTDPDAGPGDPPTRARAFRAEAVPIGSGRIAALVPSGASFTTICHELGHCFGFGHPYGLLTTADDDQAVAGIQTSREYGSPYDVMGTPGQSSVRNASPAWWYASSHEVPAASLPTGWPVGLGLAMGPNLSRAQLHLRWPEALRATVRPWPAGGERVRAAVRAPTPEHAGSVLVLRPGNEPADRSGRIVVEHRSAQGPDRGLADAPGDLAREGVVVHQVDRGRLWFHGVVRRDGVDADLAIARTRLVLTVERWDGEFATVVVARDAAPRCTVLVVDESSELVHPEEVERRSTPCGDEYLVGRWLTSTTAVFAPRVTGLGGSGEFEQDPPTIGWTVGGIAVPAWGGIVEVPFAGGTHSVACAVDGSTGRLTVTTGVGERLDVEVTATATDPGGMSARGAERLRAEGSYSGIHPDGWKPLAICIERNIPVPADLWVFGRPPNPLDDPVIDPRLLPLRERWVNHRLNLLAQLPDLAAGTRAAMVDMIRAQGPPG